MEGVLRAVLVDVVLPFQLAGRRVKGPEDSVAVADEEMRPQNSGRGRDSAFAHVLAPEEPGR